jgi:hypothetical protein
LFGSQHLYGEDAKHGDDGQDKKGLAPCDEWDGHANNDTDHDQQQSESHLLLTGFYRSSL